MGSEMCIRDRLKDKLKKAKENGYNLEKVTRDLSDVYTMHYKEKEESKDEGEQVFYTGGNSKLRCANCGKLGHKKQDCWDLVGKPKGNPKRNGNRKRGNRNGGRRKFQGKCNHCGKKGHKKEDCWDLHGKPGEQANNASCLLYTSPSPRDLSTSRMPSSA